MCKFSSQKKRKGVWAAPRTRSYLGGASLEAFEREIRGIRAGSPSPGVNIQLCLVLAHLRRKEEASEILERTAVNHPGIGTAEDGTPVYIDTMYLEAAVLVGYSQAAELMLNRFKGTGLCPPGVLLPICIAHHLGGAAVLRKIC